MNFRLLLVLVGGLALAMILAVATRSTPSRSKSTQSPSAHATPPVSTPPVSPPPTSSASKAPPPSNGSTNPQADAVERSQATPSTKGDAVNAPVSIFYVEPAQYMASHSQYVRDRLGRTKLNTILLAPEIPDTPGVSDKTSGGFIGADACADCHQSYFEGYITTSHYVTSKVASPQSIKGSFEKGKNGLTSASPSISLEMELDQGTPLQRLLIDSNGEQFGADFEFGLVTGSGKLGQTYLYWQGQYLYQMHASYLTSQQCWINSPGFADGTVNFARPVMAPCLECHATYFETLGGTSNEFRRDNFVLGVSCERCHGPGREHVEIHRQNPDEKVARAILNPADLSVERALDMCQVCHGGMPNGLKQPAFTFKVGATLADHYTFPDSKEQLPTGVHSNAQLPRLRASKCFQQSEAMTCVDCHNPHQFERGNTKLFSERCIRCHPPSDCGQFETLGLSLTDNCIDCHMASVEVQDIQLSSDGQAYHPTMRDHRIGVLPQATEKFLRNKK